MDWADLDQVAYMEREAFPTLWPPTSYAREMRNKMAEYVVCVHDGEYITVPHSPPRRGLRRLFRRGQETQQTVQRQSLVGFVGLWYMAGEAHIVAIAVRESLRGKGLGKLLLTGAIEMAQRREQQVVTLEARVSNEAAKALYIKYGFKEVGLRRRYYSDNQEDAIIMSTDQLTSEPFQTHFGQLLEEFADRYGEAHREYL
jgi:ribosomal-protein-alanine N-acetyltransferase